MLLEKFISIVMFIIYSKMLYIRLRSVIFYQEGALENWGGSGTLSKIKRGDQKIFSN